MPKDKHRASASSKFDAGETMAEMWTGFALMVIPFARQDGVQYLEMQKAFYSGAMALFNWFMVQMEEGEEPTDNDMDRVSAMHAEITTFFTKISKAAGRG